MRRTVFWMSGAVIAVGLLAQSGYVEEAGAVESCRNTGSFDRWLADFRSEAAASGIPRRVIANTLDGVTLDPRVIKADRRQGVFSQTFLKFSSRMVSKYRLTQGRKLLKRHSATFKRVSKDFGVPGPVIVAFWGLETDFGANMGDYSTIRSLATLAYDCRRPELFRPHLMDALRIVQSGDLRASEMVGAWAGELGQTQFLPTDYMESAVDYDGDGKRNLRKSVPDVLASSANVLRKFGWKRGEPWLEEVRVPRNMNWDQADIAIAHPRSQWAKWGVTRPNGKAVRSDGLQASLLLPMGRNGPAFLAYENFRKVYLEWNKSLVYATTAAYFATRLAGAPRVGRGRAEVTGLSVSQMRTLQRRLARRGYDVGKVDGILGANTRAAVKDMQIKLGLPADSYPTPEFLSRLGG